jgi:CubicO group peptidase (beta-lactamase class C family)
LSDNLQTRLSELGAEHGVPGAVAGIWHDGEVELAATGVCSTSTGIDVTTDTLFQIGSITKVWTATLVMQLVDEGLVDLDAPVKRYLPDFALSDDETTSAVTVRHLLTHTSGIGDLDFGLFGRGDDCIARFTSGLAGRPMLHEPGRFLSYCNSGFVVLGCLIETLREATWDMVIREHMSQPLGLTRTVTLPEEVLLHRASVGHEKNFDGTQTPAAVWGIPRAAGPAGLITQTVNDLLAFAAMHIDDGGEVLSADSARAMRDAQLSVPSGPEGARGLAWNRFTWRGVEAVGHDGGTIGQLSFLRVVPERRFAYALLTNSYQAALVHRDLLAELVRERLNLEVPDLPAPPEPPIAVEHRRYTGRWTWQGLTVDIADQDGALTATLVLPAEGEGPPPEIPPIAMIPVGGHVFRVSVPPIDIDSVCYFLEADSFGRFAFADLRGRLMIRCDD